MIRILSAWLFLFFCPFLLTAQQLQPGFSKKEYSNLMMVSAQLGDSNYAKRFPIPEGYKFVYRSPVVGLENLWDCWLTEENVPIINIRGTTANQVSWMANFYGAMVPAKGELKLSPDFIFPYQLALNPNASVHVGWLVSMAFLVKDMRPKIDSFYQTGAREMYIIGHSQGGGIAYLLTAYLHHLQLQQQLPTDIRFKTYCSAAPKPGNLYFAHEYESYTQQGWAYNVVNSADWVPETMVSIQTADDFNAINPFVNVKSFVKKQPFFKRIAINYAYKKLTKHNRKAADNYRKYLGGYVAKAIKKHLPGFVEPVYANNNHYVRTGNIITLLADEAYFQKFPQDNNKIFSNHFHAQYLYLTNKLEMGETSVAGNKPAVDGRWQLVYIDASAGEITALYPDQLPELRFDANKLSGSTGCNNFNGQVTFDKSTVSFPENMAMTRKFCPGNGETAFLTSLKKSTNYEVTGDTLTLLTNGATTLRFKRQ